MSVDRSKYTYENAGYNGFFRRTIASNPTETNLKNVGVNRAYNPAEVNFDERQASGSLGNIIQVGPQIEINGPSVRISLKDTEGQEVGRFGNMED